MCLIGASKSKLPKQGWKAKKSTVYLFIVQKKCRYISYVFFRTCTQNSQLFNYNVSQLLIVLSKTV